MEEAARTIICAAQNFETIQIAHLWNIPNTEQSTAKKWKWCLHCLEDVNLNVVAALEKDFKILYSLTRISPVSFS